MGQNSSRTAHETALSLVMSDAESRKPAEILEVIETDRVNFPVPNCYSTRT